MATSAAYNTIKAAINDTSTSYAIKAWYNNEDSTVDPPRQFLAYVLGGSTDHGGIEKEFVLGYEFDGPYVDTPTSSETPITNWRCYHIDLFVADPANGNVTVDTMPFSPSFTPLPPLDNPHAHRQNCVAHGINGPIVKRSVPY